MYEDNEDRATMKDRQSGAPPDNKIISQQNDEGPQMESISFMDYESYKKKYLSKDNSESVDNSEPITPEISDLSHQNSSNGIQNISGHQNSYVNPNVPQGQSNNFPTNVQPNQYQHQNQGFPEGPSNNFPPTVQQNQYQHQNQGFPEGPSNNFHPNVQQNQYQHQNQGFPQGPSNNFPPNVQPNQYPHPNQGFPQGPSNYFPPNVQPNQYPHPNQGVPQGPSNNFPPNGQPNQYPYPNQRFPQGPSNNFPPNVQPNQYPNGNRNYAPVNNQFGPQNRSIYNNPNVPPIQPRYQYPGWPADQRPYQNPNVPSGGYPFPNQYIPPNQFRPGNPCYPQFRPMPRDYYTLKEIRKSYNRTGLTLIIHSFGIIIIELFLSVLFAFTMIKGGVDVYDLFTSADIETQSALMFIISISITNVLCAVIGLAFTRRLSEFPHMFKAPQLNIKSALWAFLSVYGLQGIIRILQSLYFSLERNPESVTDTSIENINPDVIIVYFIYSVILAPITEEILFRGMILKNLSVVNKKFAIIFSAFLFGLFHENFPQMITATIIGILLAYVAVKSDSLLIPIGLHMFNNFSNEIINAVPDCTAKTVVVAILFLGAGTFGLIMFIRSMKNSDTPEDTYKRIYNFDDLSCEKKASFRSVLASPAMVIYLVLFSLVIVADIIFTIL